MNLATYPFDVPFGVNKFLRSQPVPAVTRLFQFPQLATFLQPYPGNIIQSLLRPLLLGVKSEKFHIFQGSSDVISRRMLNHKHCTGTLSS